MNSCADYIARCKVELGGASDAKLGTMLRPQVGQQSISRAKSGAMTDTVALAVGRFLEGRGVIEHAGEVLLVAHAERDADPSVRQALLAYAKKVVTSVPKRAAAAVAAVVVALGFSLHPQPAEAGHIGGEGRFRRKPA